MFTIPFNRPMVLRSAYKYLRQAVDNMHLSGDGAFTRKCHALLERLADVPKVLLTTSCTDALEMCALLLDIGPGDEVIVPSFTFVSTVNAFVLRGARPVFVDVRADTFNMDETLLAPLVSARTRAIVPVHYAGVGCEMGPIASLAGRHGLSVVEDNAHGFLGRLGGQMLGTFGRLSTLSFHETKNFTCGEGGALLLNDPALFERAEVIREKGTNRSRFYRGLVDKYSWVDVGSSYLPSEVLAALLCSQLEAADEIQSLRRGIWNRYLARLSDWAAEQGIRFQTVPAHCEQPCHLFCLLMPSLEDRQGLIAHLKQQSICAVFHYLPLHLSEMGRRLGGYEGQCPVTEAISDRLVRLPFYTDMTVEEQERVIGAVQSFSCSQSVRFPDVLRVEDYRRKAA